MFIKDEINNAVNQSTINIETLDIENISMCELREICEELYNLADIDERSELMSEYIGTASSPFVAGAEAFILDFSTWMAKSFEDEITDYLNELQAEYEKDACNSCVGSAL